MRTLLSAVLACVAFGLCSAGCGGQVDTDEQSAQSQVSAAAQCPHVAPQQGDACTPDGTRCEYPVDFCTMTYQCKCTSDRGWVCDMPAECTSR